MRELPLRSMLGRWRGTAHRVIEVGFCGSNGNGIYSWSPSVAAFEWEKYNNFWFEKFSVCKKEAERGGGGGEEMKFWQPFKRHGNGAEKLISENLMLLHEQTHASARAWTPNERKLCVCVCHMNIYRFFEITLHFFCSDDFYSFVCWFPRLCVQRPLFCRQIIIARDKTEFKCIHLFDMQILCCIHFNCCSECCSPICGWGSAAAGKCDNDVLYLLAFDLWGCEIGFHTVWYPCKPMIFSSTIHQRTHITGTEISIFPTSSSSPSSSNPAAAASAAVIAHREWEKWLCSWQECDKHAKNQTNVSNEMITNLTQTHNICFILKPPANRLYDSRSKHLIPGQ